MLKKLFGEKLFFFVKKVIILHFTNYVLYNYGY